MFVCSVFCFVSFCFRVLCVCCCWVDDVVCSFFRRVGVTKNVC